MLLILLTRLFTFSFGVKEIIITGRKTIVYTTRYLKPVNGMWSKRSFFIGRFISSNVIVLFRSPILWGMGRSTTERSSAYPLHAVAIHAFFCVRIQMYRKDDLLVKVFKSLLSL